MAIVVSLTDKEAEYLRATMGVVTIPEEFKHLHFSIVNKVTNKILESKSKEVVIANAI